MRRPHLATLATPLLLIALIPMGAIAQNVTDAAVGVRSSRAEVADTTRPRTKAIEYSDAYATRLRIHRIASYAELPLFASEYLLGDRLMQPNHADWIKPTHTVVAGGLGALFALNTVTGVWNLVESRNDPAGRARRLLHSALMIAADAGFAYTGLITASDASESSDDRTRHKNAALVSMGIATVGTAMMWLWKD
jgi:hypothetical protein